MLYQGYTYDEKDAFRAACQLARQLVSLVGIQQATAMIQRAIEPGMEWRDVTKAVGHIIIGFECTCDELTGLACPACIRKIEAAALDEALVY